MPPKATADAKTTTSSGTVSKAPKKSKTSKSGGHKWTTKKRTTRKPLADGSSSEWEPPSAPPKAQVRGRQHADQVGGSEGPRSVSTTSSSSSTSGLDRGPSRARITSQQRRGTLESSGKKRSAPSSSISTSSESRSSSVSADKVKRLLHATERELSSQPQTDLGSSSGDSSTSSSEHGRFRETVEALRSATAQVELRDSRTARQRQKAKAGSLPQDSASRDVRPKSRTQAARSSQQGPAQGSDTRDSSEEPPPQRRADYVSNQRFREPASSPSTQQFEGSLFLTGHSQQSAPRSANAATDTAETNVDHSLIEVLPAEEFDPDKKKVRYLFKTFSNLTSGELRDRAKKSREDRGEWNPNEGSTVEERRYLAKLHNSRLQHDLANEKMTEAAKAARRAHWRQKRREQSPNTKAARYQRNNEQRRNAPKELKERQREKVRERRRNESPETKERRLEKGRERYRNKKKEKEALAGQEVA